MNSQWRLFYPGVLLLAAFAALLACPTPPATAGGFDNGYVNSDGYTYQDGYWYWGDKSYSRYQAYQVPYFSCGYWYPGYYYWVYTPVTVVAKYEKVTPASPEWRAQLLEIAKQRDSYELKTRASAFEQAFFMDSVRALGLEGNFKISGYGTAAPYPPYNGYGAVGSLFLGSYGANGQSPYGYTFTQAASIYGDSNPGVLYQAAARALDKAQDNTSKANTELNALAQDIGQNQARVAEILAKGEAVQRALSAAPSATSSATIRQQTTVVGSTQQAGQTQMGQVQAGQAPVGQAPVGQVPNPQAPTARAGDPAAWERVARSQGCFSCHAGSKPAGGFVVANYLGMDPAAKVDVLKYLTNKDPNHRCPKQQDGSPGKRLSPEELDVWLKN